MYKLMIVEDEALARDAILKMIDFAQHGFEVVAVCADGHEAAEAYFDHNPDLVITDICMPRMSGLQLAGLIHESGRGTPVIIITGFDDFNYARQAIKTQVANYILKPVTPSEFRDVLTEARKKLDERQTQTLAVQKAQRQLHRTSPLVRDQILSRLVQGTFDPVELGEIGQETGLDFSAGIYQVALVLPQHLQADAQRLGVNSQLLQYMVFNITQELAGGVQQITAFQLPDGRACLIGAMPEAMNLDQALRSLAQRIWVTIRQVLKADITVGGGHPVQAPAQIQASFLSAQQALDQIYRIPGQAILFAGDLEIPANPVDLSVYEEQVILKVRLQEEKELVPAIADLSRAIQSAALSQAEIRFEWNRLANRLLGLIPTEGIISQLPDASWPPTDAQDSLVVFDRRLQTLCLQCMACLGGQRNRENQRLGLLAQTYIKDHYADSQLSLMAVSNHANISLSYFSQIFKEETGKTFVEFLTEVRMEKAKELLRNTDRMLYDIAERVGYDNPAYFTVAFKKQVGLSPRDYRKQFGKRS
ncbi:MAG: response regulator [Clostridia bacterium]|nr:response regulator [Clostridia bacterium]NCC75004.1 response regulator [Clostridia bacterium]